MVLPVPSVVCSCFMYSIKYLKDSASFTSSETHFIQPITCSAETARSHDCGKTFLENSGCLFKNEHSGMASMPSRISMICFCLLFITKCHITCHAASPILRSVRA